MENKTMRTFFVVLALTYQFCSFAVENSIIPAMEKFETLENLPTAKYSKSQYNEIQVALNHQKDRIRIVTYNMLFNLYDHNLEEQNRWHQRLPRLVEMINEMKADIIGVQELYSDQLEGLMPHMEEVYSFYAKPCEDGELNGIFYRKDRFEVVDSRVLYMTETPDVPSSETLTMIQIKDQKTGQIFGVFNTHLAFSKIEKRDFQAKFIVEQIESFSKQMPVVLMGDLNTFPNRLDLNRLPFYDGDYVHRLLTQNSLRDAREVSILGHLGPIGTFTNSGDDGEPFKGTGTPGIFLDHIYISKGVKVLLHAVQPGTVRGQFPSDHQPVIMDCLLEN